MSNKDVIHVLLFIQCMHSVCIMVVCFCKATILIITNASKFEDLCMGFSLYLTILIFLIYLVTKMLCCGHWEFCAIPFCDGLSNKDIMNVCQCVS